MYGTQIKDTSNVVFGLAKLHILDYTLNIANVNPVNTDSSYVGSITGVGVEALKTFKTHFEAVGNVLMPAGNVLTSFEFSINDCTLIEINQKNLSLALGGDGVANPMAITDPKIWRAELVFTYPNKVNKMTIILPKCQLISSSLSLKFGDAEEPLSVPLEVKALYTSNANWTSNPLGRFAFS